MRRPRHKLQVSTFPFLAVLLGAMGSLIFLLLVMDRRAKIVALNKVRQAQEIQAAKVAAVSDGERQRREDWERRRQQLHDALAAEDYEIRGHLQDTMTRLNATSEQMEAHARQERQLQALLAEEQMKLNQRRDELRQRQATLLESAKLEATSKTKLAKLTSDLLELEQTLANLKRLKERQQPTYSLVAYRGARGENRMPIYVECNRDGLVFLPERLALVGDDLDLTRVRTEVERRHGPLLKAKREDPFYTPTSSDEPYVLFLIRPDGIKSYYRAQNALRGYKIDYGYEMVDADWTLEVPDAAGAVARAPLAPPPLAAKKLAAGAASTALPADQSGTRVGPRNPGSLGTPIGVEMTAPVARPGIAPIPIGPGLPPGDVAGAKAPSGRTPGKNDVPPSEPGISFLDGPAPGLKIPGAVAKKTGNAGSDGGPTPPETSDAAKPEGPGAVAAAQPPEPGNAMARLAAPSLAPETKSPPRPAPLTRVVGNRDFIITLACYEEGVLLTPGGASFVWNNAADARQVDEELVRTVTQLVSRRQATVRPGEPPYRPVLRFEVRERGRRTYHRVYPLLDHLRLPMVREDRED